MAARYSRRRCRVPVGLTRTAPSSNTQAEDRGENAQSVGALVAFGQFRGLHLGDPTVNKEFDLMCPDNPIGTVDLFIVSHHGLPSSNSAAFIHAIAPRVALMNDGTRKGGPPESMTTLHSSPGLEDLWQLHFSLPSGQEYTVPGLFIANLVDNEPATMTAASSSRTVEMASARRTDHSIRPFAPEDTSMLKAPIPASNSGRCGR